jgi:hypothetical protein
MMGQELTYGIICSLLHPPFDLTMSRVEQPKNRWGS